MNLPRVGIDIELFHLVGHPLYNMHDINYNIDLKKKDIIGMRLTAL